MADQTTSEIVVDAAPDQVMAVIADFDAYPQWATGVKQAEVLEQGPTAAPRRCASSWTPPRSRTSTS